MKNFKRGVEGMKGERHTFPNIMGKRGAAKNSRQKKNWYHREMRRIGKNILKEE